MTCQACGAVTEYVEEVFGEVCTECGTLVDTLQAEELVAEPICDDDGKLIVGTRVVHDSIRSAADNKGAYRAKKMIEAHSSLSSLLRILKLASLETRAKNIFDRAMDAGNFKWGRTSTLVEGASVAVSLRESGRCESLCDIAVYISVKFGALARMYHKVQRLLGLQLAPSDAVLHFSSLLSSINALLSFEPSPFPQKLHSFLESTPLPDVSRFAISLSSLTQRVSLFDQRAVPPVACALIICAYEGITAQAMPQHTSLASKLCGRVGCGQRTVLERYGEIGRLIQDWTKALPWANAVGTGIRSGSRIRANNARAMKDAVDFQQEIWRAKVRPLCKGGPIADDASCFGLEDDDSSFEVENQSRPYVIKVPSPTLGGSNTMTLIPQPHPIRPPAYVRDKARWLWSRSRIMEQIVASSLRLDSVSTSTPPLGTSSNLSIPSTLGATVLSKDAFLHERPRSNLSKLAESRGGEHFVQDEELFELGELEGLLRSEREILTLEAKWDAEQANQ
ncbi:uncharacterized protein EI90DRAFT_3125528 [Cantharellus anzutake]|uniref:uncharacterized protein n=1 Tax=Cantharellus anzutake TaxID=1750568 RepID=UPI001903ABAC|nr:uncharacterized protein EI90DRAFT_3125528 [Cantharellus anzutake]KAF8328788.1 hypothetical protein EI90DRAFT_3125528 [Cantharellus anzutake]